MYLLKVKDNASMGEQEGGIKRKNPTEAGSVFA